MTMPYVDPSGSRKLYQPKGTAPSGIDPNAVAANPQGYQDWLSQAKASGQDLSWMGGDALAPRPKSSLSGQAFGTSMTPINPEADLRSQQIAPGFDPRLAQTQKQTDTARNTLANTAFADYTPVAAAPNPEADQYRSQAASALGTGQLGNTDTSRSQNLINQAAQSYGAGGVSYGGDTTQVRGLLTNSLSGLNGPDRSSLAQQAFKLLQEQNAPARALAQRQVGQKAASLGRIGAGMTTNDLTGLEQSYAREDDQAQRALAQDAAARTLEDRLGITGALQSGFGALAGQDTQAAALAGSQGNARASGLAGLAGDQLALDRLGRTEGEADRAYGLQRSGAFSGLSDQAFGQGQSLRNEARGEGDRRLNFDESVLNRNRGVFSDLGGEENRLQSAGQSYRNELRGERGNQQDQAQQGIDNALRQRMSEEDLLNSGFNRGLDTTNLYDRLGNEGVGDYLGALGGQAQVEQGNADQAFGGIGDLLGQYLLGQATNKKGSATDALKYATRSGI